MSRRFLRPRVLKILADELGKDPMEIVQDGSATWLLMEEPKEVAESESMILL